jgi:hypothetical protein
MQITKWPIPEPIEHCLSPQASCRVDSDGLTADTKHVPHCGSSLQASYFMPDLPTSLWYMSLTKVRATKTSLQGHTLSLKPKARMMIKKD